MCITSMAFMRASWSYERASSLVVGAARATGATKANSKAAAARLLMLESFIRDMIVSLCEVGAQRSSRERYARYGDRVTGPLIGAPIRSRKQPDPQARR